MKLYFTPPDYPQHMTRNGGLLPSERAVDATAAWHFARLANIALARVPEQATLEGEVDQTIRIRQLADSTCKLYGVKIETMMAFIDFAKAEAIRVGLKWDHRLDTWIRTGGKGDEVTRDPDRLFKS